MTTGKATRYPISAMVEARRLRTESEGAMSVRAISQQLRKTHGVMPSANTILRWIDPDYAAKDIDRGRTAKIKARAASWTFRFPGTTTQEFRDAFVRELRDHGQLRTQIAITCTVVFGERWTESDVRRALGEPLR